MIDPASNSPRELLPGKNLAHVASIEGEFVDLAHQRSLGIFTDCDDLGLFSAAKFVLPDGFEFWIYKYQGMPNGSVEVFFESQLQIWEARLSDVLNFLGISSGSLTWKNAAYLKTP
ncbi:hypothetical protein [Polaromonas sp. YR568]|uniref:hypothetical protein n=1 Tax=Polaromonas sp. YR568 TaxID=1855301 RepID=UPI0011132D7E|nr:hypothetical protein [Polaromonas sp. YR568]